MYSLLSSHKHNLASRGSDTGSIGQSIGQLSSSIMVAIHSNTVVEVSDRRGKGLYALIAGGRTLSIGKVLATDNPTKGCALLRRRCAAFNTNSHLSPLTSHISHLTSHILHSHHFPSSIGHGHFALNISHHSTIPSSFQKSRSLLPTGSITTFIPSVLE